MGQSFTWKKKRSGVNYILERIDKAITSVEWFHLTPSAKLINHIFTSSYHSRVTFFRYY